MASGNPHLERWSNGAVTSLDDSGGISASDTLMNVLDESDFPTDGDFHVTISGNEIVYVTKLTGSLWTIERGKEGTTAVSHPGSAPVALYLTSGSIDQAFQDGFALPDYPLNRILDEGVTTVHSDFTWFNQGTATSAEADDGGILLTCPSEALYQIRGKHIDPPSTPWTLTTYCMLGPGMKDWDGTDGSMMGPVMYDSGTGEFYILALRGDRIALMKFDDPTTYNSDVDSYINNNRHAMWLQVEDDGTDIKGSVSVDGYVWEECFNEGRTTFLSSGPDKIGFAVASGNGTAGMHFYVKSWIAE